MVSHGRQKKDAAPKQRKPKKGKNNEDNDIDGDIHDMELPDDFSIAGGSSVYSEANSFNDFEEGDQEDENNDDEISRSEVRQAKLLDSLSLTSTLSSEKRSAKREAAYKVIFRSVTQYADGKGGREILESSGWESLSEACMSSLRGGSGNASPAEQYAACRVLEACCVVLGEDRDDVVENWNDPLKKVVNATGRATQVRCAALRCLAMMHFICGTDCLEDGEDCSAVMELCEKVGAERFRGEKVSPLLRSAALDSWALLATTFHDARIAAGDADDDAMDLGRGLTLLPLLASCLESPDVGLRSSAGECVAYIHECRLNLGLNEDEAENTTERRFRRGSWDGTEWEVLMDEVKQRIAELSVESGHHMSKKTKKEQRATFRDYMSTIVDDESPTEEVNFRGGKLKLKSWKEIIQLNFVRHCLQGGFQVQLMTNETLHDIFGAVLSSSAGMSQLEKRLFLSKQSGASKAADKAMTKQRRTRTNVKNHFLTADGDDTHGLL
ncbi:hypothetical protein HJC23_000232 [Cyclotella cryptica]|uniref:Interferon-related developmental regulator N-terminal domain-containing protein n=1 Tax=Cyclotella cryptica TaxID=29204 RepID=A0ABD3PLG0_9STRA|eukprot:CCRYP_013399-RA/>CCRYP_013399-RA protein AED:0.15 eAED:0.15 QI:0/-1/0/1/-1/1/1/0/496